MKGGFQKKPPNSNILAIDSPLVRLFVKSGLPSTKFCDSASKFGTHPRPRGTGGRIRITSLKILQDLSANGIVAESEKAR
jgi:hypothetical protein